MLDLVLGGVRSGKSQFAEKRLQLCKEPRGYLATASNSFHRDDPEFSQRIAMHRQRRPSDWLVLEEPLQLATAITQCNANSLLVDCVGVWLTNLLLTNDRHLLEREILSFMEVCSATEKELVVVSSEVGFGVLPAGELSRDFVDQLGLLNQRLAERADSVWLSIAGIVQQIK
ncbi:bifunctional adenosylcobinamide kinase/adenosylcobinamide-phosphate guanylyltransferase [Aestuariirhabdus sp. LZHN29]|uniref:bifunctional adenosylcobinamide kinase/adenosylcobinamide-phosphate guanylyltransferase n=1 Tax=Aestuariirhabdus sp. LZHN29 TaxID=3417462 RepID=UPI003CE81BAF